MFRPAQSKLGLPFTNTTGRFDSNEIAGFVEKCPTNKEERELLK